MTSTEKPSSTLSLKKKGVDSYQANLTYNVHLRTILKKKKYKEGVLANDLVILF